MSRTRLLEETKIGMAITQRMLKTAQKFADCQFSEADSKRVYFNTIAVLAVNNYLQMMEIPTDLKQSDSCWTVMQVVTDPADLMLPGIGSLECRPLVKIPGQESTHLSISPEVPDDGIGLVVVEIDLEEKEATLCGFTKTVQEGDLPLDQLGTMYEFLGHLADLEKNRE